MKKLHLTTAQTRSYFKAAAEAAKAIGEPVDEYRHRVMMEECRVGSMKQMNRTTDYEKVMQRFKSDAGDYKAAISYVSGDERRMVHNIRECVRQVFELEGIDPTLVSTGHKQAIERYLNGILSRSGIVAGILPGGELELDVPIDKQLQVFQMIDTQRRRLIDKWTIPGFPRLHKAFNPDTIYEVCGICCIEKTRIGEAK